MFDVFDTWLNSFDKQLTDQPVPVLLQIIPTSCDSACLLEEYGNIEMLKKLEIPVSRAGKNKQNYDVYVYRVTDPGDPQKVR